MKRIVVTGVDVGTRPHLEDVVARMAREAADARSQAQVVLPFVPVTPATVSRDEGMS